MIVKRVNGKLMIIEKQYWTLMVLLCGVLVAGLVGMSMMSTADARHVDADGNPTNEPHCYTSSCEKRFGDNDGGDPEDSPTSEYEALQEQKETKMDAINEEIKRVKQEIKDVEAEIEKLETDIPELRVKLLEQNNTERLAGNEHKGMQSTLKAMKKEYRSAYESAETTEEIDAAKQLKVEYLEFEHEYNMAIANENKEHAKTVDLEDELDEKEDELDEAREKLIELEEEFDELKLDMFKAGRNDQFVSIRLSGTCEMLIASGHPHKCPTYQELVPMFDNTDARISGDFVWDEKANDLNREKPRMQNYELYYEQVPNWLVITVDPDARMMVKGSMIEIQPNRVHFTCTPNAGICQLPENWDKNERYIQYDIHINKYCTHAIVSPNMDSITTAVNQMIEGCADGEDEWRKLITIPIFDDIRIYNHGWINDFLRSVGVE